MSDVPTAKITRVPNATIVGMEITAGYAGARPFVPTNMELDIRRDDGTSVSFRDLPFRPVHLGERVTVELHFPPEVTE